MRRGAARDGHEVGNDRRGGELDACDAGADGASSVCSGWGRGERSLALAWWCRRRGGGGGGAGRGGGGGAGRVARILS